MVYKKCVHCGGSINLTKDKYVLLGTYNGTGKAKKDEQYFHFNCWKVYFQKSITAKLQNTMKQTTAKLSQIMKNNGLNNNEIDIMI